MQPTEMSLILNMSENSNATNSFHSSSLPVDLTSLSEFLWFVTAYSIVNIFLLLPLYIFILILACQRRGQHGSSSTTSSHLDVFTYHMVAMEMLQVLSCFWFVVSKFMELLQVMFYSFIAIDITWRLKSQFHALTCAELYLGVVHPLIYLRFKDSGGIWIRNISAGFAWLLLIVWGIVTFLKKYYITGVLYYPFMALVLIFVTFCYISVLWTLKRPGPGDRTKDRDRVDQSKQRASHIITIIMVVLWLSLGGAMLFDALQNTVLVGDQSNVPKPWTLLFSLPGSLVLPLLFLQRAGKLPCSRD